MTLTGERILKLEVSHYDGVFDPITQWPGDGSWESTATGIFSEQYFDLSGYELEDLTLVPKILQLQDGGNPYFAGPTVTTLHVYDVISQERLDPASFLFLSATGDYPGSPGTTEDWSQILMMNKRFFTPQTTFTNATLMLPATSGSFGSAEPTAVSKLWCYRIIVTGGSLAPGETLHIPATRFVLGGTIVDEPELEYMMRLKRSYELSTQGD